MDTELEAMVVVSFMLANSIVTKLYQMGKISPEEAEDIYDFALLGLEHHQAVAGSRADAVALARQLVDGAIQAVRLAPDRKP